MKTSVFDFMDYKDFIRMKIETATARGYHGQLAKAAQMHGSFLSKILKSHVHMTPDQAADLCVFWEFGGDETLFFLNTVHLARAGSANLKVILRAQLDEIQKQRDKLANRFKEAAVVDSDKASQYYAAWYLICVHLILLIPQYRTIEKISERLLISAELVKQALLRLESLGLVECSGGKWRCKETDVHLGNDSGWANVHHSNWHAKSILKIQENAEQLLKFSSVMVVSKKTAAEIKKLLQDNLEDMRKVVKDSAEESLYFLGINFYEI